LLLENDLGSQPASWRKTVSLSLSFFLFISFPSSREEPLIARRDAYRMRGRDEITPTPNARFRFRINPIGCRRSETDIAVCRKREKDIFDEIRSRIERLESAEPRNG